jgi:ElaB/YqjD/DUF883 family membrane-anchored ribosome-binding protein
MEETRAALSEKVEQLEQQVVGTVQDATSAVAETVENVKEAVHETVESVKGSVHETVQSVRETFDLERQVDRHPWLMVGASVAVGYAGGRILGHSTSPCPGSNGVHLRPHEEAFTPRSEARFRTDEAREPEGRDLGRSLSAIFAPELKKLKELAIGVLMGTVRDMVARSVQGEVGSRLTEVLDDLTTKLGGEPSRGPVFPSFLAGPASSSRVSPESGRRKADGPFTNVSPRR